MRDSRLRLWALPWRLAVFLWASLLLGCAGASRPPIVDSAPPAVDPQVVQDAVPYPAPIMPAGNSSPYTVLGKSYHVMHSAQGYQEEGIASWYGLKFHGRKTANGERFNSYLATAAHKTLPIPTWLRVTNLANNRQIVVKVNDRGPFHGDRLIDLSYGAALKLGFAEKGTAPVRLEAIDVPGMTDLRPQSVGIYLQIGAFARQQSAQTVRDQAAMVLDAPVTIERAENGGTTLYRVRVGPLQSEPAREQVKRQLQLAGLL